MARKQRYGVDGITFELDIDNVIKMIGAGLAMNSSMKKKTYLDSVVDVAFARAEEKFNNGAAAYAATGAISHMYEWGTLGINNGRSNIRLNPDNPVARLWETFNEGQGLNRTLWFAFKPSLANVPKPTARDTGMSTEVISKLKDHVFKWKAQVMENGEDVTISPKDAKFLLVPAYKENRPYMRPHDITRGYALYQGPIHARPGATKYAGSFTKFWMQYWMGIGEEIVQGAVEKMILEDFEPELNVRRVHTSIRPVQGTKISAEIEKERKKTEARVKKKANARKVKNDTK